jgi:hyaluronate lyase
MVSLFERLRLNGVLYMTGGTDYDPLSPHTAFVLKQLDELAGDYQKTMERDREDYLWGDLQGESHDKTCFAMRKLYTMALAYHQYGSEWFGSPDIKNDVLYGMDWISRNRYNPEMAENGTGDWWYKEIACGLTLGYLFLLAGEWLTPAQVKRWDETIDAYNPNGHAFSMPWGPTHGVNRIDKCMVFIFQAVLARDEDKLNYALDGLNEAFEYAPGLDLDSGTRHQGHLIDGFYPDGSFLQHTGVAHTGGYGTALLEDLPFLFNLFDKTPWAFDGKRKEMVGEWVHNAYIPVMFKGGVMDFVKDREISRVKLQSHTMGHRIASALCGLANALGEPDAGYCKAVAKGWIAGDTFLDFFSQLHEENQRLQPSVTIRMERLINDAAVKPITGFTMGRVFAVAARAVQHRPKYAFNIAMNSSRNKYYETIHGESLRSWYINEGMTSFYASGDLAQFDGGYWATVDLYRLPGTTVDTVKRANCEGGSSGGEFFYSGQHFAGGVQLLDAYVTAGYQLSAYNVSLTAKKSWFMLENQIVCLGADINSGDNRTVETILENRKLQSKAGVYLCEVEKGDNFIHYISLKGKTGSKGGFYLPTPTTVKKRTQWRKGNWNAIGNSNKEERNPFLTLWIDHGKNPAGAEYAYIFLPNATLAGTKAYAKSPKAEILENSKNAQAVRDKSAGITGINFWAEGGHTAAGVTCDKQASFMMAEGGGEINIAVSDPTWQNDGEIRFTVDLPAGGLIEKDEAITLAQFAPKLIFTVKTEHSKTMGKTFRLRLKKTE